MLIEGHSRIQGRVGGGVSCSYCSFIGGELSSVGSELSLGWIVMCGLLSGWICTMFLFNEKSLDVD